MSKIPSELENPIDIFYLNMCDKISPFFYNYGVSPNMITTISLLCTVLVIILLLHANYIWAALFVLIAYFFDSLDGYYARKYSMTSKFGALYDSLTDDFGVIAILITLYYINPTKFYHVLPVIIIAWLLGLMQIGCQDLYFGKNVDHISFIPKYLCIAKKDDKNDLYNKLRFIRFFSFGTFTFIVALCIIYYKF